MSSPDERSELHEAIASLTPDVEALMASGQPLLSGPAAVQLLVRLDDASTPQEAVDRVINQIARVGLNTFTFAVIDAATGEEYFVQAGQLLNLEELKKTAGM